MNDDALRREARRWLGEGRRATVVEVRDAQGSVPREAGARMLVAADGEAAGTVGGGHLEWQAIARARELAARGGSDEQRIALGPALGQCCGGVLTLRYLPLDDAALATWPEPAPRFHLQLYGAGHVGRAIVRLLHDIPCRVQWIDERESEFPPADAQEGQTPHIERVCVEPVEAEVALAPPGAHYLILTHSHDLDLRIAEAVLRRGDFAYCGLIGSRTKRARFLNRFEARGVAPDALARLTCPIGVPGIAGKQPAVVAIAVVAQLLQASGG
jgi:xanthine dehydrogenase accessory factor